MKNEYELLREELLECQKAIAQYNVALYATVSAISAYVLQSDLYYLYLVPFCAIVPLYLECESKHQTICRIAAYLYVFWEGEEKEHNWERRHHEYDTIRYDIEKKKFFKFLNRASYYIVALTLCSFSIYRLYCSSYSCNAKIMRIICVVLFTTTMVVIMRINTVDYVAEREKMIIEWEKVKEQITIAGGSNYVVSE